MTVVDQMFLALSVKIPFFVLGVNVHQHDSNKYHSSFVAIPILCLYDDMYQV